MSFNFRPPSYLSSNLQYRYGDGHIVQTKKHCYSSFYNDVMWENKKINERIKNSRKAKNTKNQNDGKKRI